MMNYQGEKTLSIKIEHNIPPPEPKHGKKFVGKYPFRDMRPGDSFRAERYVNTTQARIMTGWHFIQRQEAGPDGTVGVRVWRVA